MHGGGGYGNWKGGGKGKRKGDRNKGGPRGDQSAPWREVDRLIEESWALSSEITRRRSPIYPERVILVLFLLLSFDLCLVFVSRVRCIESSVYRSPIFQRKSVSRVPFRLFSQFF